MAIANAFCFCHAFQKEREKRLILEREKAMSVEQAICQVLSAWGVSPDVKTDAIWCLMNGGDMDKIVRIVERLETALGALETIKQDLAEKHAQAAKASEPQVCDAEKKTPKIGDRAYTRYHGENYVGVLAKVHPNSSLPIDAVVPTDVRRNWGFHSDFPGILVGYDKPIEWDDRACMWYAPANSD